MIGQDDEVISTPTRQLRHPPDLGDAGIRPAQVGQRLLARRAEVMRELVVLHERAVDDGHAEIYIEQNRHRLQLAHDDVAQDADEGENPFRMRDSAGQLAAGTLPLLQQPLEHALEHHAQHSNGVEQNEQRHPRSAKPAVHGHLLARGDCERYCLCVAIHQIDVARATGERAGRMNSVPDVLHSVGRVASDDFARGLVVEAKRGDAVVLAVEHSRLAVRRRRGQSTEPTPQRESLAQQARDRRAEAKLQRATQVRVGERIDLQHDEPTLWRTRSLLARERPVLRAIVPSQKGAGARTRPPLRYARWRSIWRNSSPIGTGLSSTSAQPASRQLRRDLESLCPVIARVVRGSELRSRSASRISSPLPSGRERSSSITSTLPAVARSIASTTVAAESTS